MRVRLLRDGFDIDALNARDLFGLAETYWIEELAEVRLLSLLLAAASGGRAGMQPSTRDFLADVIEQYDDGSPAVDPTESAAARRGQAAAESLMPAAGEHA